MSATCGAAILARNDAPNLRWALRSLAWCDEIVVVDMESDDDTAEVARAAGARVLTAPLVREFDQARRALLGACLTDWVLLLDCDEIVPPPLAERLRQVVDAGNVDIAEMAFCNYLGDWRIQSCGYWPDYHARLFRRNVVEVTGRVDDYLRFDPDARRLRLPPTPELSIHHFTYRDVSHFVAKMAEYTYLRAALNIERGRRPSLARVVGAPVKEFLRRFLLLGGIREGWRGLSLSLLLATYRLLFELQIAEQGGKIGAAGNEAVDRRRAALLR